MGHELWINPEDEGQRTGMLSSMESQRVDMTLATEQQQQAQSLLQKMVLMNLFAEQN